MDIKGDDKDNQNDIGDCSDNNIVIVAIVMMMIITISIIIIVGIISLSLVP